MVPGLPNSLQNCGGRTAKVVSARIMRASGRSAWIGMGCGRAQHSVICG